MLIRRMQYPDASGFPSKLPPPKHHLLLLGYSPVKMARQVLQVIRKTVGHQEIKKV